MPKVEAARAFGVGVSSVKRSGATCRQGRSLAPGADSLHARPARADPDHPLSRIFTRYYEILCRLPENGLTMLWPEYTRVWAPRVFDPPFRER